MLSSIAIGCCWSSFAWHIAKVLLMLNKRGLCLSPVICANYYYHYCCCLGHEVLKDKYFVDLCMYVWCASVCVVCYLLIAAGVGDISATLNRHWLCSYWNRTRLYLCVHISAYLLRSVELEPIWRTSYIIFYFPYLVFLSLCYHLCFVDFPGRVAFVTTSFYLIIKNSNFIVTAW